MNAAQQHDAQTTRDLFNAIMTPAAEHPALPTGIATFTEADLLVGGANEQQAYINQPALITVAVEFVKNLFFATHTQQGEADVARIATFDVDDLDTFSPNGEKDNLHNHGMMYRMFLSGVTLENLQTGDGPMGIIPLDSRGEEGTMLGNGFARWMRNRLDGYPGGALVARRYNDLFIQLRRLRPNFFNRHPDYLAYVAAQQIRTATHAQLQAAAQAAANAAAGGQQGNQQNAVAGGGVVLGAGVGGGVNNVTAANFVKLIETIPPLVVVNQKLPILSRLEACDSAIRQVLNFFRVNVPTITDAQKVQGFLKSLADSNQAMFVQEDGRRQAQNMPPAERLVEMVKSIRPYISDLLPAQVEHLDRGFLRTYTSMMAKTSVCWCFA